MVGTWAAENHLMLGQVKIDDTANEISTIPKLLALLDLTGCIVTIDAVGCQHALARQIRDQGAHYVLSLKENQEGLYEEVEGLFKRLAEHAYRGCDVYQTLDGEHVGSNRDVAMRWRLQVMVWLTPKAGRICVACC